MNATEKHCSNLDPQSTFGRSEAIAWSAAFGTEAVAVLAFNLITIAIFATNKRLRVRKFYLLFNLTIADLLVGATAVPFFVYRSGETWGLWGRPHPPRHAVRVSHLDIFSGFLSIINLAMIAIERFYATFWPLRYHVLEKKVYVVVIALIWFMSTIPPSVHAITSHGLLTHRQQAYIWVPFTVLLFLIMCVCYAAVLVRVVRGKRQQRLRSTMERNRRLSLSLLILTGVSLITWMPYAILHAFIALGVYKTCNMNVHYILRLLHYANSLVNPIIYVMRIPHADVKTAVLDVLRWRSTRRPHPPLPPKPKALDAQLRDKPREMSNTSTLPNASSRGCTLTSYQVRPNSGNSDSLSGSPKFLAFIEKGLRPNTSWSVVTIVQRA